MKKKIVIASVLKPVDDVRAYWKLSQSIAKTNKYEVNIIGNRGKKQSAENHLRFYPHHLERSDWPHRIFIRTRILQKILRIRPDLLIICTHELLLTALIAKLITGCKVVYDVQENYYLNMSKLNKSLLKTILARFVRLKEKATSFFIDEYWLAESCYLSELSFVRKKNITLENKAFEFPRVSRDYESIRLIYSGTISAYGGIELAIEVFKKIKQVHPNTTIKIIGQIHDERIKSDLTKLEKTLNGVILDTSSYPIPHTKILEAISTANLGIIAYQPSIINHQKVPTKLYEYSRYRLPYLIEENTKWSEIGEELGGAIPINFNQIVPLQILNQLKNKDLLFPDYYPKEATWENEALKINTSLKNLIK